jgi:hypothetical protein
MNPGTVDSEGIPVKSDIDIGIRRNRTGFYLNLFDRVISFSQFGIAGQTFKSKENPAIIFVDLVTEYAIIKEKLHLGYGLNSYNGISRLSNAGAPQFLTIDVPGFAFPFVGSMDESGRQLGVYIKGLAGDFDYRISYNQPFLNDALDDTSINSITTYRHHGNAWKGYFNWQFMDNEHDIFPWKTMNYLGAKRIFNLGAGFYYQKDAMISRETENGNRKLHDIFIFALDAFLEWPLADNSSITGYLAWYDYDMGPGFLKKSALMNTGYSGAIANEQFAQGGGNSEWSFGTGNIIHFQGGYLFPGFGQFNEKHIQLVGSVTTKDLDRLGCRLFNYDIGMNHIFYKNHVRLGIQLSSRPVYVGTMGEDPVGKISENKWGIIFNTQIDF